ncbi:MAG: rhodanese-like domain-containing protein [Clostridiales bacterium]|nr:rhodanese-like domain-containing protein [Clostridiales bacterium]
MKKLLSLVLCLTMLVGVTAALAEVSPVVAEKAMNYLANYDGTKYTIKAPEFFAQIDAGEDMMILDIRQADAYAEGHVKGAVSVPFGMTIAESLANIPDDTHLYVYCYTGQTASQTTALLNVAGKFATNVQGGFNNGISATEGFEKYVTTDAGPALPTDTYAVDPDVQAAITAYYSDMVSKAGTAFANNNFAPDSLKEVIDAQMDDYFIYSVRQAADFATGHIQGAVNNPFGAGMEKNFAAQLPTDKKIIVYCYSGQTASQTTAILRLLGYDAYNLSGGMGKEGGSGWLGKGYAVTTD